MSSSWQLSVAEQPANDGPGEDRWLFHEAPDGSTWAAVIDGASSSSDLRPTGGDYADALRTALLAAVDSAPNASPQEVLGDAIARTIQRLDLPKPSQPSAAVGLVRIDTGNIEACVLGDVTVVVFSEGSETLLRDDRLGGVGSELRQQYREALRAGHGYGRPHEAFLSDLRAAELAARNHDDGYWIAADLPAAAGQALSSRVPSLPETVILASDGAAAAVAKYRVLPHWRGFAEAIECDPAAFVDLIRGAEQSDALGQRWPRSKPHDDIAALIISRRGAS